MSLPLGQLVYTSFPVVGFRTLASEQIPTEIQQVFIQQVVYHHWNPYNPPALGYRAAYLHQVAPEHNLFGWLYSDGLDDLGRDHVPYFICYYLAERLHTVQLENIFTCLLKGPVELIDRQSPPADLKSITAPNLWSYQSAGKGVAVALDIRERSHLVLNQGRLINLFVPVVEREMAAKLNGHQDQQKKAPLIHPRQSAIKRVETGSIDGEQEYQRRLQLYEQVLVEAVQHRYPLDDRTRTRLKLLQQTSKLKDEDVARMEAQITQQRAAVQSAAHVSKATEEQRTSHREGVALVKLLNNAVAARKAETSMTQTKLPAVFFGSRQFLFWGLAAIATITVVTVSLTLLPTPFKTAHESAELERNRSQHWLDKQKQTDSKRRLTGGAETGESNLGFPMGTPESVVIEMLGKPTQTSIGYWPNTYTTRYDLVPNQITVAYLFDGDSKRVRQTEASFSQSVDSQVMQATLNGMLDGRLTREIQQGFQQVRQRQSSRYSFAIDSLKGVIERKEGDFPRSALRDSPPETLRERIYIRVWDANLH